LLFEFKKNKIKKNKGQKGRRNNEKKEPIFIWSYSSYIFVFSAELPVETGARSFKKIFSSSKDE